MEIRECNIQDVSFIFPCNETSFFCITKNGELLKINIQQNNSISTENISNLEGSFDPQEATFFYLNLIDNKLFVASTKDYSYFVLTNNFSNVVKTDQIKEITKIINDDSDLYFTTKSTKDSEVFHVKISDKLTAQDFIPEKYYKDKEEKTITDIAFTQKSLIVLHENSIHVVSNSFNASLAFRNDFIAQKIFLLERSNFFLVIARKGKIMLIRLPESPTPDVKEKIKQVDLSDLHKCEIQIIISSNESFLTFDEKHTLILWENLPNWWNAPHFLDMFGENQSISSQQQTQQTQATVPH